MDLMIAVLIFMGSLFILLTSIGIVRLPDFFTRIQTLTKASTLGIGLLLVALMLYFEDISVTPRALLILFFIFVTNPVAAHMLGRAAYFVGVPLWKNTLIDELKGKYNTSTHELKSD